MELPLETRSEKVDPARWVDDHGDYLYRFALARTGRPDLAEDLVQETLLAGLRRVESFGGRATERTWLTTILRNKFIDQLRKEKRSRLETVGGDSDDWVESLFDRTGHWRVPPGAWNADPSAGLQKSEFWEAIHGCLHHLPDRLREILTLRLLDNVPPDEIRQTLDISAANLWTLLHRARMRLWKCLESKGQTDNLGKQ